jgi:hypothetical protein
MPLWPAGQDLVPVLSEQAPLQPCPVVLRRLEGAGLARRAGTHVDGDDGQRRMPATSASQLPAAIRSWSARLSPAV